MLWSMEQILIHVVGAIAAALALSVLGLNKRKVVVVHAKPVGWIWKLMALIGKFLFWYGLLVFLANLTVGGIEAYNTRLGVSLLTFGLIFWIIGGLVIYFKRP